MSIHLVCFVLLVRSHFNALCFPCVDILSKSTASTTLSDSTAAAANVHSNSSTAVSATGMVLRTCHIISATKDLLNQRRSTNRSLEQKVSLVVSNPIFL